MSIVQIIFIDLAWLYAKIQKKFPNVLPSDPLKLTNTPKLPFTKFLMKLKTHAYANDFETIIKNELLFFIKNQKELGSHQSIKEMGNILSLLKKTEGIKGDVIELGIASGGTTIMMARFLKQINSKRKIYGCDTFNGFPYEDKFSRMHSEKVIGTLSHSLDSVHAMIKKFNVDDKIVLVKGPFEDTLYSELAEKQFSYVFVDCDLYDATKYSLDFVWLRLSKNGFIIFDEYEGRPLDMKRSKWGETKAVNEFCDEKKIKIHLYPEPMLIK